MQLEITSQCSANESSWLPKSDGKRRHKDELFMLSASFVVLAANKSSLKATFARAWLTHETWSFLDVSPNAKRLLLTEGRSLMRKREWVARVKDIPSSIIEKEEKEDMTSVLCYDLTRLKLDKSLARLQLSSRKGKIPGNAPSNKSDMS